MADLSSLVEDFAILRTNTPQGYSISERVIDPLILIDKKDTRTIAFLCGTRNVQGKKVIYKALGPSYNWVLDEKIIRPLPKDAPELFAKKLGKDHADNLSYSGAIRLLRHNDEAFAVEADPEFSNAGKNVADRIKRDINIPGLTANLFPYQAKGVKWMASTVAHTQGLILADEMGLGKTLQIIALLLIDPPKNEAPALIVCPTSLVTNWRREVANFAPSLSVLIHHGPYRAGIYKDLQKTNIVVTTYDTMVSDISLMSSIEWSWVICDEAQAIKNPDSNRRNALMQIPRERTIAMTGTPVENTLVDLWSLVDFVIPGLLGTNEQFEKQFPDSLDSASRLGTLTDPIILQRKVIDVANDLPPRIDIDYPLDLGEELSSLYRQVRDETIAKYTVAGNLVATLQMQLFCAHPWLRPLGDKDPDGENARIERDRAELFITPKIERTVDLLREAFINRHKVIVFSLFNRCGDILKEACNSLPDAYWGAINGSTPQEDRQKIIDDFSTFDGPGCLVLNPKAAGSGLNITAATIVIHFTPVWNPALEAQASARAYRRGQQHPVTVYRLFYENTVERVMIDRAHWKRQLGNELLPVSVRDNDDLQKALSILPEKA